MEIVILIAVFVVVSFAFLYVFRKQNKELKNLRKVKFLKPDICNLY